MYKKTAHALSVCLPCLLLFAIASFASAQDVATPRDTDNAADTVPENSPVNTRVGITAQAAGATNYTLTDSAGGLFAINPQSGVVTVAIDMLDYEAFPSHSITVLARNATNSQTMSFTVQLTDVPEPLGPVTDIDFNPDKITFGATRGTPVGITARATDPDQGSVVRYSLSGGSTGLFIIGEQDGIVTLSSNNYDPDQDYFIEVTARSSDDTPTSQVAQFIVRRDKQPIRIAPSPTTLTVREGESQDITFSYARVYLEAVAISAGLLHSCAIITDNDAVCWGSNTNPAGMRTGQTMPPSGRKFIAVSVGELHSCGITISSEAVCWGDGDSNQLIPPSGKKFIALDSGGSHNCGITTSKEAVCWGAEEGDGRTVPTTDTELIAISVGDRHSCGITIANDAVCWGEDTDGQSKPPPRRKFIAIGAGSFHTCGITIANDAVCWGDNGSRQTMPPSGKKFIAISAGNFHNCGITTSNEAVCWGDNNVFGESAPPPDKKFIVASAGWRHSCGVTAANEALCWGSNKNDNDELVGQSAPLRSPQPPISPSR